MDGDWTAARLDIYHNDITLYDVDFHRITVARQTSAPNFRRVYLYIESSSLDDPDPFISFLLSVADTAALLNMIGAA